MKVELFFIFVSVCLLQAFDDTGDYEYFITFGHLEPDLRLRSPFVAECFKDVIPKYKKISQTFATSLVQQVFGVAANLTVQDKKFKGTVRTMVNDLVNYTWTMNHNINEIETYIKRRNTYDKIADFLEVIRISASISKENYKNGIKKLKTMSHSHAAITEDLFGAVYNDTLKSLKETALTYTRCMHLEQCSKT